MGEPTGTLEMAHNGFKPAELATEMIFQVSKDVVMEWDSLRCCSSDLTHHSLDHDSGAGERRNAPVHGNRLSCSASEPMGTGCAY